MQSDLIETMLGPSESSESDEKQSRNVVDVMLGQDEQNVPTDIPKTSNNLNDGEKNTTPNIFPSLSSTAVDKVLRQAPALDVEEPIQKPATSPKLPTLTDVAKFTGKELAATAELAMTIADSMVTYFPSKLYGVMALPFGRKVAEMAENSIARVGYKPYTKLGQQAMRYVNKGFKLFLTPSANLDKYVSKLSPRAGYLARFGAELAEFAITGELTEGAKTVLKPKLDQAIDMIKARKNLELESIANREKEVAKIPDEEARKIQQAALDMEKAEVEAKAEAELDKANKEDLREKGKKVAEIRKESVTKREVEATEESGGKVEPKVEDKTIAENKPKAKVKEKTKPKVKAKTETKSKAGLSFEQKVAEIESKIDELIKESKVPEGAKTDAAAGIGIRDKGRDENIIDLSKGEELGKEIEDYYGKPINEISPEEIRDWIDEKYRVESAGKAAPQAEVEKPEAVESTSESDLDGESETIRAIEDHYGRDINNISDKEIEDWFISKYSEEPTSEVDLQTGARELEELGTEESPFREKDPEVTAKQRELLANRNISDSPELLVSKLINDVNSYLDGNDGVDIAKTRDTLSDIAVAVRDPNNRLQLIDYFNGDSGEVENFIDTVGEAAKWARRAEREGSENVLAGELTEGTEAGDVKGTKLYSIGGAATEAAKEAIKIVREGSKKAGDFVRTFNKTGELKKFKLGNMFRQIESDVDRAFLDQTESFMKKVRKAYPDQYNRLVTRYRAAITGKGYGSVMFEQASKEIYSGKTDEQVKLLDLYIHARRFKDIYSYVPNYKHEPGYGPEETTKLVSTIDLVKDIPKDKWNKLIEDKDLMKILDSVTQKQLQEVVRAADAYFEHIRKMIDFLVETGVKSPEEGKLLKAHDYKKFKSIYVDKLYDFNYDLRLKGSTIKSTNSGVVDLGQGSIKVLDTDSKAVLIESLVRGYGSGVNNVAKLAWRDFALEHPDNGFVHPGTGAPDGWRKLRNKEFKDEDIYYDPKIKKSEEYKNSGAKTVAEFYRNNPGSQHFVKGTGLKVPKNWVKVPYLANGIKKNIYFHPEAAKYLITGSKDISYRMARVISMGTLAPVTRQLAVGLSPAWATLLGLPMDVAHTLWTARTWEADARTIKLKPKFPFFEVGRGKFKRVYNPYVPLLDKFQLGRDMETVWRDVYNKGPLTQGLMRHGLMMNFLTQRQGRYLKGIKPPGDWAKILDLTSSWGLKMELWPRVATARRVILREAKKLGISFDEAMKNEDIMYKAAHAARDRMDYNQGGWFVKALDHSGINFLNAAVLGTRTFWRDAIDDPAAFTTRTVRLGTTAAGLTLAAWSLYPEEMKNMRQNPRKVQWPIAPKYLRAYDRDGNLVTFHFKLNMDPNVAFLYRLFEGLTLKYMYDSGMIKTEPDYRSLVESLKHLGPADVQLQPLTQGIIDYATNYSWWKSDQIYKELGGKTFDWPKSRIEGAEDRNVPQIAKDIGKVTKLSPKRLAGAGSSVIPYNNEFVQLMNMAYEGVRGNLSERIKSESWLLTLAELPGVNRIVGITRHGSSRWRVKDEVSDEEEFEALMRNAKFDRLVTDYAWYGERKRKEVVDFVRKVSKDKETYKRLMDALKFAERPAIKNLPHRKFWLSLMHMSAEGRARTLARIFKEAGKKEEDALWREYETVARVKGIKGVLSPEVRRKFREFMAEDR